MIEWAQVEEKLSRVSQKCLPICLQKYVIWTYFFYSTENNVSYKYLKLFKSKPCCISTVHYWVMVTKNYLHES